MTTITALILAAGQGVRMGPRGRLAPKGLFEVGGAPLIAHSLEALRGWARARGLDLAPVIVTGHLAEQYAALLDGSDVRLVHNPHFAATGSLTSLAVGLEAVEGPVILLESDILYAPRVLDALDPARCQFLVSGPTGAGDEAWTWLDPDSPPQLAEISKDRGALARPPLGEMIGISMLNAEGADRMRGIAAELTAEDPGAHYEPGIVALARQMPLDCVHFEDVPWGEMDDEAMLSRLERDVWPRIARETTKPMPARG